jgi:predicted metal-dependent hydrolase
VPITAEPELTTEQQRALSRGIAQFNRGRYFECHETLEEMWSALRGPSRDFFQGLIQVSVGFLHLDRGNRVGAARTFARALARFERYPARYCGFDLTAERTRLQTLLAALADEEAVLPLERPRWRFDDPAAAETRMPGPPAAGAPVRESDQEASSRSSKT